MTYDESCVVVAVVQTATNDDLSGASSSGGVSVSGTDWKLEVYDSETGKCRHDVSLRNATSAGSGNGRCPFNRMVALKSQHENFQQQLIAVIDNDRGSIMDVRRRPG